MDWFCSQGKNGKSKKDKEKEAPSQQQQQQKLQSKGVLLYRSQEHNYVELMSMKSGQVWNLFMPKEDKKF